MRWDTHFHVVGRGAEIHQVDQNVYFNPDDNNLFFTRIPIVKEVLDTFPAKWKCSKQVKKYLFRFSAERERKPGTKKLSKPLFDRIKVHEDLILHHLPMKIKNCWGIQGSCKISSDHQFRKKFKRRGTR